MKTDRFGRVKFVLWVILFANLLVAIVKIVVGYLIKSNSLTADGVHSLTDGSSNVVGLFGIRLASRPVDDDHPYGHQKYETLGSLFIAGMLVVLGIKVTTTAISRLVNPVVPEVTFVSLVALVATLGVNIFVSTYELRQGRKLESDILVSDSYHTRSDIFISIGVLAALIGVKLGLPPIIDPIASLVVSGFIFYASYEIVSPVLGVLSDKVALDPEVVREIVCRFEQVRDVHKIRSRGRTDDIFLDLHIMIDPDMIVADAHRLTHDLEKAIGEKTGKTVHAVIHVEPYRELPNDPAASADRSEKEDAGPS